MSKLNKKADIVLNGDELKRMLKDYEYDPVTEFGTRRGTNGLGLSRGLCRNLM